MVDAERSLLEFDEFDDIYDDEGELIEDYIDDDGVKRISSTVGDEVQNDEPWYKGASGEFEESRETI